jgi:glycosyltransferase involved in cell wall biosynthesis
MRRITHVITTIERGGAEKQLLVLVGAQVKKGDYVTVAYLKGKSELEKDFRAAGVASILNMSEKNFFKQIATLRKFLKQEEQLVHGHLPRAEIVSVISSMFLPSKVFLTRHNAEKFFPAMPKEISSLVSRIVTKRAKCCISISASVAKFLENSNEVSKSCLQQTVYYGFEPRFSSKPESGFEEKTLRVGTISRLVPQKDIPTLLNGFEIFSRKHESSLRIVGDGILRLNLINFALNLDCANRVEWLGRISNVEKELLGWDLFVLTSRYEGFGMVLLEAMDCGVPIVASNLHH